VLGGVGDGFFITGPLATNAGQIDLGGTSTMVVDNAAGVLTQTAGTLEMGTGAALSAGSVEINGGVLRADGPGALITANLIYDSPAASTYQGVLAGAGNALTVSGGLLVLSGTNNSYSGGTFVMGGQLVVTSPGGIPSGTNLNVGSGLTLFGDVVPRSVAAQDPTAVPEPGTLALLAAGIASAMFRLTYRRRGHG
jgi:autotransporter-associated beta strand protein